MSELILSNIVISLLVVLFLPDLLYLLWTLFSPKKKDGSRKKAKKYLKYSYFVKIGVVIAIVIYSLWFITNMMH